MKRMALLLLAAMMMTSMSLAAFACDGHGKDGKDKNPPHDDLIPTVNQNHDDEGDDGDDHGPHHDLLPSIMSES